MKGGGGGAAAGRQSRQKGTCCSISQLVMRTRLNEDTSLNEWVVFSQSVSNTVIACRSACTTDTVQLTNIQSHSHLLFSSMRAGLRECTVNVWAFASEKYTHLAAGRGGRSLEFTHKIRSPLCGPGGGGGGVEGEGAAYIARGYQKGRENNN